MCQIKQALSQTSGTETKDGSSSPASCLDSVTVFSRVLYSAAVGPQDATWTNKGRETGSCHVCNSDYINIFTISRMSFLCPFFTPSGRRCHWREKKYTENRTQPPTSRLCLKCDGTRAETRFSLSAKRTSPFKSAGASVQSTTGSRGVRITGSNARYTMFRGTVKSTGHPLHSPVSSSLPLPASPCAITFQMDSTLRGKKESFMTNIKATGYSAINSTKSPASGAM